MMQESEINCSTCQYPLKNNESLDIMVCCSTTASLNLIHNRCNQQWKKNKGDSCSLCKAPFAENSQVSIRIDASFLAQEMPKQLDDLHRKPLNGARVNLDPINFYITTLKLLIKQNKFDLLAKDKNQLSFREYFFLAIKPKHPFYEKVLAFLCEQHAACTFKDYNPSTLSKEQQKIYGTQLLRQILLSRSLKLSGEQQRFITQAHEVIGHIIPENIGIYLTRLTQPSVSEHDLRSSYEAFFNIDRRKSLLGLYICAHIQLSLNALDKALYVAEIILESHHTLCKLQDMFDINDACFEYAYQLLAAHKKTQNGPYLLYKAHAYPQSCDALMVTIDAILSNDNPQVISGLQHLQNFHNTHNNDQAIALIRMTIRLLKSNLHSSDLCRLLNLFKLTPLFLKSTLSSMLWQSLTPEFGSAIVDGTDVQNIQRPEIWAFFQSLNFSALNPVVQERYKKTLLSIDQSNDWIRRDY